MSPDLGCCSFLLLGKSSSTMGKLLRASFLHNAYDVRLKARESVVVPAE